eukprot:m.34748 g.34748  ORF g.34748 m.34748 type:complete len:73 (+) comp32007_c0_seq5:2432-2650(+)
MEKINNETDGQTDVPYCWGLGMEMVSMSELLNSAMQESLSESSAILSLSYLLLKLRVCANLNGILRILDMTF